MVCLGPSLRAALSRTRRRNPTRSAFLARSVCRRSRRDRCGARARCCNPSSMPARATDTLVVADLRSRRVARRSRRSDARHLCLRSDAQGAAHPLLSAAARAARRRRRGHACRHRADHPRHARSARRRRACVAARLRGSRAPGAAEAVTYFEALSGSLNRGWAPLAASSRTGSSSSTCPFQSSTIFAPIPVSCATSPTHVRRSLPIDARCCVRSRVSRFGGSTRRRT